MTLIMSERYARWYSRENGLKDVVEMGGMRVEHPNGRVELRPIFRGLGGSDEPYPPDEDDQWP